MRILKITLLLSCLTNLVFAAKASKEEEGAPLQLKQVFEKALEKNENIGIQTARTTQADERLTQAVSTVLPKLTVTGSYTRQDSSAGTSGFLSPDQSAAKITLTQPLFHGLKEFSGYDSAKADLETQKALEQQSRLTLYSSVGQVYYNRLSAEQDLQNLESELESSQKRIAELKARAKIGRTRMSELLSSQAQESNIITDIAAAKSVVEQSKDQLTLTTGLSRDSILYNPTDDPKIELASIDFYLNTLLSRPDIISLQKQVAQAEEQVEYARGSFWPSLDFTGNYYLVRQGGLSGVNWDAGVTATVPLFQGGLVSGQVGEAQGKLKEKELLFAQGKRTAERDIRVAYQTLDSGLAQLSNLKEGFKIAEKAYAEQNKDYRFGLSTNLDVLQALETLQITKRQLDRTRYQAFSAWTTLEASVGKLP